MHKISTSWNCQFQLPVGFQVSELVQSLQLRHSIRQDRKIVGLLFRDRFMDCSSPLWVKWILKPIYISQIM